MPLTDEEYEREERIAIKMDSGISEADAISQTDREIAAGPQAEPFIVSWYLSSPQMTVQVNVRDNRIIWAAPIIQKFVGQPMANLARWMKPDVLEIISVRRPAK